MFKHFAKNIKNFSGLSGLEALTYIWQEVRHNESLALAALDLIDWRTTKNPTIEQQEHMERWWNWINCSDQFQNLRQSIYRIDDKLINHFTCQNRL